MSALPAYSEYAPSLPERRPVRPTIGVIRGAQTAPRTLPSSVLFLAKLFAVVLAVMAVLGFCRVTLNSATVTTALAVDELSSRVDTARSEGNKLEVALSTLSNPTRVKAAATALGMGAPETTTVIDISDPPVEEPVGDEGQVSDNPETSDDAALEPLAPSGEGTAEKDANEESFKESSSKEKSSEEESSSEEGTDEAKDGANEEAANGLEKEAQ